MAASWDQQKSLLTRITHFAVISRILVIIIQLVSNLCIPDHDAGVFNPPVENKENILDGVVNFFFGGFRRWDAIYFTHIAQSWYTYENSLVFFPFYPLIVFIVSKTIFYPLSIGMSGYNVTLVSSLTVNMVLFIQTAKEFFKLGKNVLKNDLIAYKAALLFCINPASIFMTAPYSEILYFYLTVKGLTYLADDSKLMSSIHIGFASVTRSNGLLNTFYLGNQYLKLCRNSLTNLLRMQKDLPIMSLLWIYGLRIMFGVVPLLLSALPFLVYQYYCYLLYCTNKYHLKIPDHLLEYGRRENLKVFGDNPSQWCNNTVPLAYSFIQKHHWNQGFLNYWEFKQIPNFLLATPVCVLVFLMAKEFYNNNSLKTLWIMKKSFVCYYPNLFFLGYVCHTLGLDEEGAIKKDNPHNHKYFTLSGSALFPFVVHAVFLTIFGIFCIHVQVLTRLLFSSIPMLYWYTACLITPNTPIQCQPNDYNIFKKVPTYPVESTENIDSHFHNLLTRQITRFSQQNFITKVIFSYFIGYLVIGTVMFSNFLPWT